MSSGRRVPSRLLKRRVDADDPVRLQFLFLLSHSPHRHPPRSTSHSRNNSRTRADPRRLNRSWNRGPATGTGIPKYNIQLYTVNWSIIYIYILVYIYVRVCLCACVCVVQVRGGKGNGRRVMLWRSWSVFVVVEDCLFPVPTSFTSTSPWSSACLPISRLPSDRSMLWAATTSGRPPPTSTRTNAWTSSGARTMRVRFSSRFLRHFLRLPLPNASCATLARYPYSFIAEFYPREQKEKFRRPSFL